MTYGNVKNDDHAFAARIRVSLVTNHRLLRVGLQMLIESKPSLCVVDDQSGTPAGLTAGADVIVIDGDYIAPGDNSAGRPAGPPVIVLTCDCIATTRWASALGAAAVVNSLSASEVLVNVIEDVHRRARVNTHDPEGTSATARVV